MEEHQSTVSCFCDSALEFSDVRWDSLIRIWPISWIIVVLFPHWSFVSCDHLCLEGSKNREMTSVVQEEGSVTCLLKISLTSCLSLQRHTQSADINVLRDTRRTLREHESKKKNPQHLIHVLSLCVLTCRYFTFSFGWDVMIVRTLMEGSEKAEVQQDRVFYVSGFSEILVAPYECLISCWRSKPLIKHQQWNKLLAWIVWQWTASCGF